MSKKDRYKRRKKTQLQSIKPISTPSANSMQDPPKNLKIATGDNIINHIKDKVSIAFVQDEFDCCSQKCIVEYSPYFEREHFACLMVPRQNYSDILKYLCKYVVLFRTGAKEWSPEEVKRLIGYLQYIKTLGIRIVYYVDDLIFWWNNKAPISLLQVCDAAIVANPSLKAVLTNLIKFQKPIIVVPTHVSLPIFDSVQPLSQLTFSNRFKVLLTSGGRIGVNDAYAICEIANDDPELAQEIEWIFNCQGVAQFRSILNKFRNLKKTYIDWLSSDQHYGLVKSVDLIIHPAHPQDLAYMCPPELQQAWLDCKSEVKYTLAGAAKIPIISSPTASYKEAIRDGETGFIVSTPREFIDKIHLLKNDKFLCKKIGEAARLDIEQRYQVENRYPLYRDAILGKLDKKEEIISVVSQSPNFTLFIPPIEGGPRTFYENMKRGLPEVSKGKWDVTNDINTATAALAIAFVAADAIINEKIKRPNLKVIYRLDGLPMNFEGELDPTNLTIMQNLFKYANKVVWQSKHCQKMWQDQKLVSPETGAEGLIIHNGVDLTIFSAVGNSYVLPNPKQYNFLNLNWSTFKHKRLDLLQEFIKAQETNSEIAFYLIGNYISTSQIANVNFWKGFSNVTYLGQMRNQSLEAKKLLASIYRTVTGLIFTSEMEGSPNTVLEALGCSCPVIYNANSDIVPEILVDACLPLSEFNKIFDPTIRQGIVQQLPIIAENYSIEKCIHAYLEILEK